ncbi:DUF927 domain-containing protein [Brevibacillus borstelensis]|uniref:DUF927 domain-containing protein n=1 Tax=Brevibacillus borstelensis TaxID=45462 RepID=UPI001D0B1597|nr:DUF927 domain-containing protein [Brevibacillus borstelensis]MCC0566955.1 DUF927 domain-containing protein [Brevibacillus borstelensis]
MAKEESKIGRKKGRLVSITNGEEVDLGAAIDVDQYVTNVDTGEVTVRLSFLDNGKRIRRSLKRNELTRSGIIQLTRYGADCWPEVADAYVSNLRKQITKKDRSYEHSNVGWGTYEDQPMFKLQKAIGFPSTYDGVKYDLQPKGTFDAWFQMVQKEILGTRWLEFALAAGFTAPLLPILKEEAHMDSLFFNFYGASSTGKTLCTRIAVSIFGLPDTGKRGLLITWYGTDQGILYNLHGNYGVPIVIDDTSMMEEGKDLTQFIYTAVAGLAKMALTSQGTRREQGDWMTTIFSSSEKSIFGDTDQRSGIRVRFFEINEKSLTRSPENAENIEKEILQNYGHAGPIYVKYLMKIGNDEIQKRWRNIRKQLLIRLEQKDSLTQRIAGKLAIVQLAGELANEALELGLDIDQLTETLLYIERKSMTERNKGDEAYNYIMGYFVSNRHKFFRDKSDWNNNRPIVGKYVEKNGIVTQIQIPKEEFEKLMRQGKFNVDQVVALWKDSGRLIHDTGKNTLTRVFQPGVPKMAQYVFKTDEGNGEKRINEPEKSPALEKSSNESGKPSPTRKMDTSAKSKGFSLQKGPLPEWAKDTKQLLLLGE